MDVGMAGLMLTWIEWVEVEVRGFRDLLEGLRPFCRAVMAMAVGQRALAGRGPRIPSRHVGACPGG